MIRLNFAWNSSYSITAWRQLFAALNLVYFLFYDSWISVIEIDLKEAFRSIRVKNMPFNILYSLKCLVLKSRYQKRIEIGYKYVST